jgi:hypothetical protein
MYCHPRARERNRLMDIVTVVDNGKKKRKRISDIRKFTIARHGATAHCIYLFIVLLTKYAISLL